MIITIHKLSNFTEIEVIFKIHKLIKGAYKKSQFSNTHQFT